MVAYCSSETLVQHVAPQMNSSLQSQEQVCTPLFLLEKLCLLLRNKAMFG